MSKGHISYELFHAPSQYQITLTPKKETRILFKMAMERLNEFDQIWSQSPLGFELGTFR